ncbi:WD40 repeat-like protein [Collybia nuda]|uniref:DNA damage-binding protein CMR1 n=1 Tax=Collybia nuda TaxID=64659 RepID=A0A9P5Y7G5_9AGAR|nr:WD40 repeat-like protein [Collybia nuda]
MVKLSQYEIEREANIARNRALLEELELKQAVVDLGIPRTETKVSPVTKAKPVQSSRRPRPEKLEAEAPRRQSLRLRKETVDPNESPSKRKRREAELEEQRAKEAEERLEAEERARITKRPRHHDLGISTLAEEGLNELSALSSALYSVAQTSQPRRVGDPEAFSFDDNKKDEACLAELRARLQQLQVVSRAKVTQDRVYSAAYHPEITKDLIFFGDKHGQLGIWDARAPAEEVTDEDGDVTSIDGEGGKYWRLQLHWPPTSKSSISCVKFDPVDSHNVYTSSYDSTIRSLSFTSGISREIFSMEDNTLISCIDLTPSGHEIWISDSHGRATHMDLRESKKFRRYGLSDAKIGCISVNPTRPHFVLTASNNRSLKIWDVRNLQKMTTELSEGVPPTLGSPPASGDLDTTLDYTGREFDSTTVTAYLQAKPGKSCLRAEWRHDKSVSSAYWDPRGRGIVSTSYDDTLRLWDIDSTRLGSSSPFASSRPFSRFHHNCQTGKWLTVLRAQWSPNPDVYPHFTIGNMTHSLDIYSCKGDLVTRLTDSKRISAVQAVTCSHPGIVERAASGNASGRCVLWAVSDVD